MSGEFGKIVKSLKGMTPNQLKLLAIRIRELEYDHYGQSDSPKGENVPGVRHRQQPTPTVAKIAAEERQRFESYWKEHGDGNLELAPPEWGNGDAYKWTPTADAWGMWQAAVAQSQEANNALEEMTAAAGAMNLETIDLRARLATAEALLGKAEEYLDHGTVCPALGRKDKTCDCGLVELREAIDKAKEGQ